MNPKDPRHKSLFSTAIIKNNAGHSIGYLYIVLNSHKKVLSAQKFQSYTLGMKILFFILVTIALSIIIISYMYFVITKPIINLNRHMLEFKDNASSNTKVINKKVFWKSNEIFALEKDFESLKEQIVENLQKLKDVDLNRRKFISHI